MAFTATSIVVTGYDSEFIYIEVGPNGYQISWMDLDGIM